MAPVVPRLLTSTVSRVPLYRRCTRHCLYCVADSQSHKCFLNRVLHSLWHVLDFALVSEDLMKPFLFQCGGPDFFFGLPNHPLVRVGKASQLVFKALPEVPTTFRRSLRPRRRRGAFPREDKALELEETWGRRKGSGRYRLDPPLAWKKKER